MADIPPVVTTLILAATFAVLAWTFWRRAKQIDAVTKRFEQARRNGASRASAFMKDPSKNHWWDKP